MARLSGFRAGRPDSARLLTAVIVLVGLAGLGAVAPPIPAASIAAAQATPVASPAATAPESVEFAGLLERAGPLSIADLKGMPVEMVDVTYETRDGAEQHTFTGTRLYPLLESLGPIVGPDERNPWLTRSVVVTANDGYRVLLSGGELDSDFGNAPIILAWEQDGQPLIGEDGPVRLVTPGDTRGGRYVYGVVRIEVLALDPPTA